MFGLSACYTVGSTFSGWVSVVLLACGEESVWVRVFALVSCYGGEYWIFGLGRGSGKHSIIEVSFVNLG